MSDKTKDHDFLDNFFIKVSRQLVLTAAIYKIQHNNKYVMISYINLKDRN